MLYNVIIEFLVCSWISYEEVFYQITIDNRDILFKFNPQKLHITYTIDYTLVRIVSILLFWGFCSLSLNTTIKIAQLQFCVWDVRYFNSYQSTIYFFSLFPLFAKRK